MTNGKSKRSNALSASSGNISTAADSIAADQPVIARQLVDAAQRLRESVNRLSFGAPVSHVYNPLDYAWAAHETYLNRFANSPKRVLFLGMNPGPFGMMQVGVPFGEIEFVRSWMGIDTAIQKPAREHPLRPIDGFDCTRSEVSGRRLWTLFASRFESAQQFFQDHLVLNYCPLAFLEETGRNRTPDKLPAAERDALYAACDEHLRKVVEVLQPQWIIGVGDFAARRAREACDLHRGEFGRILHPSPASPVANRDWAGQATRQLQTLGIWT